MNTSYTLNKDHALFPCKCYEQDFQLQLYAKPYEHDKL